MTASDDCACGPPGAMPRVDWQPRTPLSAAGLEADQAWRRQMLRRHNRVLHGPGVICGLHVVPAAETGRPWAVRVCPGYGIGPYGDEVSLCCSVVIDVAEWLWSREPPDAPRAIVAITPSVTEQAGPRPCGCGHAAANDGSSRVRELAMVRINWETSSPAQPNVFDLCRDLPPLPPCPDDPALLLAFVKLPPHVSVAITDADISPM